MLYILISAVTLRESITQRAIPVDLVMKFGRVNEVRLMRYKDEAEISHILSLIKSD